MVAQVVLSSPAVMILTLVVVVVSAFFYSSAFTRQALVQVFYILILEKLWHPSGFPRLGKHAVKDVTDKKWLSRALQKKFPGTKVADVSAKAMGSDMGNASTMFRLNISYESNPKDLPNIMIVKLPKDSLANRVPFNVTRMNESEVKFYGSDLTDELLSRGIHVPRGFGGEYHPRGGNCYALMEDVTQIKPKGEFTNEESPIETLDEGMEIVKSIGKLHGAFFNARDRFDSDLSWVVRMDDPVFCMTTVFFKAAWNKFLGRLGDQIPEDIAKRGLLLAPIAQQIYDFMSLPPVTIVHGDCHLENSYFVGKARELGFYDMQLLHMGKGAMDLATFMGGSFTQELLGGGHFNNAGEMELLKAYLKSMSDAAGGDLSYVDALGKRKVYDLDTLYADYRLALALMFVMNVCAVLAVPFNTEASLHYDMYAKRLMATIHRTSALNFALYYFTIPKLSTELGLRGEPYEKSIVDDLPIVRCIPGRATNIEHNVLVHQAEITPEDPVTFLDKYLWRPLKYKFIYRRTASRAGYHGQKTNDVPHAELEGHHSVKYAEGTPMEHHAFDSYYLSSFSQDCPSFALRWCRRHDDDDGELWLLIKLSGDDDSVWISAEHPNTTCPAVEMGPDTVMVTTKDGSKMTFTCIEPMTTWQADFDGFLKNQATGEIRRASFKLTTSPCMGHFSFGSHVSAHLAALSLSREKFSKEFFNELQASHQEHYEQFCHITGPFTLGDQRWDIRGKGMRDRAFGVREWGYLQRYTALYFWADPYEGGPSMTLVMASLPTMTSSKFGFVCEGDGQAVHAIESISGKMSELANHGIPPQEWEHAFRCNNKYYLVRSSALPDDAVGLNMKNAMWINVRFTNFELNVVDATTLEYKVYRGVGASEFGYRFHGYTPVRPTKAVAAPVHAKMS